MFEDSELRKMARDLGVEKFLKESPTPCAENRKSRTGQNYKSVESAGTKRLPRAGAGTGGHDVERRRQKKDAVWYVEGEP